MPQAVAVAYTASTLGAAARCSKSTSFLPLMPLSRLVARHSRMLSRSYGGRVCGAVACVWPVLTRLLSVPCLGHTIIAHGERLRDPVSRGIAKCHNRTRLVANTGGVTMTTFDVFLSVLLPAPSPALPEAMAGDTSMGGYLDTARATQLVDIVR